VTATRTQLGLIAGLLGLAAVAWWSTAHRMAGMDMGPGTDLGPFTWFVGVWVVMTAAMMFPSAAPTVAVYARMTRARSLAGPTAFAAGYLATWTAVGLVAYAVAAAMRSALTATLAWDHAGRWVAGGTLIVAAAYELTPLKDVCLRRCRGPLPYLMSSWRDGVGGAASMGARHGAWCVGCCWALMASLFALGVMSVTWMAGIAALIAFEKTLPWGRAATYAVAIVLLAAGVALIASPGAVPGLVVPHHQPMTRMG
jgi:predicted metal-binding membrane protein